MPVKKIDIAREYLSDAFQHYKSGHFFSALTLGGVAEEILGQAISHLPKKVAGFPLDPKNALESEVEGLAYFERGEPEYAKSMKSIRDRLLHPKNSAKHYTSTNESTIEIDDPQLVAGHFLLRAISNYRMVFPHLEEQYRWEEEEIYVYQLDHGPFGQSQAK